MRISSEKYRLKKMAKLSSGAKQILDIGWAEMPNPYLKADKLVGFDLIDRDLCHNYTDRIVGDIQNFESLVKDLSVDCVVLGEFLEHVENPIEIMRTLKGGIQEGGKVILSTPNPNSFIERLLTLGLNRKYFYTSEHIMLYPQRWLIRLMEIAGYTDVKLYSGGFPVPGFDLMPFPRAWCYQTIAVGNA